MPGAIDRRALVAGLAALAGCDRVPEAQAQVPSPTPPPPPLKSLTPFSIGTCVQAAQMADPVWAALATQNCNQLTPEWEMKME
jgi:endo-1,4-beta-xylanase